MPTPRQLATCGHRGHKNDPLYACRRTLHTGADLLTDKQRARLAILFGVDAHVEVEATWTMYQRTVAAYREPDRKTGRTMMAALITTLSTGVPEPLQADPSACAHITRLQIGNREFAPTVRVTTVERNVIIREVEPRSLEFE